MRPGDDHRHLTSGEGVDARFKLGDFLTIAEDGHISAGDLTAIGGGTGFEAVKAQGVILNLHGAALHQRLFGLHLKDRAADYANADHRHAQMDDIATVAPTVARHQRPCSGEDILATGAAARPRPTEDLVQGDEPRQRDDAITEQRQRIMGGREERDIGHQHQRQHQWDRQRLTEPTGGGRAPCRQRRDAHQQEQRQKQRRRHQQIIISADRDLGIVEHLGDDRRAEAAPEDSDGQRDEDDIVQHKQRLTAKQTGEFVLVAQFTATPAPDDQPDRDDRHRRPEQEHRQADLAAGEAVDTVDQAAAGGKCAEQDGGKRPDHQKHIPQLEHPALFLNHHAVDERGPDQPRQEGRILDRVPAPVAAPSQHIIGPASAEQQAKAQKQPRHQRPAAHGANPVGGEVAACQCRHRKGKRDGEANETEIQHRRVNDHPEVAQQRVQPLRLRCQQRGRGRDRPRWDEGIGPGCPLYLPFDEPETGERILQKQVQPKEKGQRRHQIGDDTRHQTAVALPVERNRAEREQAHDP